MINTITKVGNLLENHPSIGLLATITASIQSFIETASPILQFIGLIVGVSIGIVTLLIKIKHWKKDK